MKIRELQQKIADALNGVEELVQGGCMAFAEDSMTVQNDIHQQLAGKGGVAICIVTPTVSKSGQRMDGIAAEYALAIQCNEKPELNRKKGSTHLTALDAAEIVAASLDGDQFTFVDIRLTGDQATRTVTATVNLNYSGVIS